MASEYDFITISLKKDVVKQIDDIISDAKRYGIFISKSELLRVMIFNPTIVEYSIKVIIKKNSRKTEPSKDFLPTA